MLQTRLEDITDPDVLELLGEIEHVKHLSIQGHQGATLFNYLSLTQRHPITHKPENIQAAGYFNGSILKTPVKKLTGRTVHDLAQHLCAHFQVSEQFIDDKKYYVFLNQIFNPKSKLRKPPPFYL